MPKLLQINSVLNTGSTGRIVEQIGQYALSQYWESFVAYGRSSNLSKSNSIKVGNEFDQAMHGLRTRIFDQHGLGSKKTTGELIEKIDSIKPDIIHLHNLHGYYLNYPFLFNYLAMQNAQVVWTLHDCWAFTGHCTCFSDINCEKWKTHCEHCPKKKNYPSSFLLDNSYQNFEIKKDVFNKLSNLTIVTVSQWLGSLVKESILQSHPIETIHNGVDLDELHPLGWSAELDKKHGFSNRKVLLAVATSWGKNKGWDDYIALSKLIPSDYVIVMVGVTQKQMQDLPHQMIGIERTESIKELASLYSHATIVLNLSYQESFGMSTAESFACGTPVIVYNATASPELVTQDTGIVVELKNLQQVIAAIEIMSAKGKDYYSKSCRKLAIDKYNRDDRYNDYFQLYTRLLAST